MAAPPATLPCSSRCRKTCTFEWDREEEDEAHSLRMREGRGGYSVCQELPVQRNSRRRRLLFPPFFVPSSSSFVCSCSVSAHCSLPRGTARRRRCRGGGYCSAPGSEFFSRSFRVCQLRLTSLVACAKCASRAQRPGFHCCCRCKRCSSHNLSV